MRQATFDGTFEGWRAVARALISEQIPPHNVVWVSTSDEQQHLPVLESIDQANVVPFKVPKKFMSVAQDAACFRGEERWALLYKVLWRTVHGEPNLIDIVVDNDVRKLLNMESAVRRDAHKMKAFVRFRQVSAVDGSEPTYVAWFTPSHYIVERTAPFFVRRFTSMKWSILTPYRSAHWDKESLVFTSGVPKSAAPTEDSVEDLWRTYYASIFNPNRIKVGMMCSEMPKKYWVNLPEARLIPELLGRNRVF